MYDEICRLVNTARRIVAFTGAGISAESGIPTYRGKGGMWTKYDPDKYASIDFFNRDPSYYWNFFKDVRFPLLKKAKPNPAHYTLAQLEETGKLACIITQNIDGLHQMAGSKDVIELHGNTRVIRCISCSRKYDMDDAFAMLQEELPPHCKDCSNVLRPDVVFFGESLPKERLERAFAEACSCDLLLAIGSSLVVYPAAHIPVLAKQAGAKLAIINMDPTPLDEIADCVLHCSASAALDSIARMESGGIKIHAKEDSQLELLA